MRRRVFVSSPIKKHLTSRQRRISNAIVRRLKAEGLLPQIFDVGGIPDRRWTPEDCLEVMAGCQGAVLVAFPRWLASNNGAPIKLTTEFLHYEGVLARAIQLPILTIVEEGVAIRGIIERPLRIPEEGDAWWVDSHDFNLGLRAWLRKLNERHDVFLGYCSKGAPIAKGISDHLKTLGVSVRNWKTDFRHGRSIIDEIEKAAWDCSCAIFVFSPDDEFVVGTEKAAAPRDNVIFEAGYFMSTRGRQRVLIVREGTAKMPADLGGNIYASLPDRRNLSAVKREVSAFIKKAL